MFRIAGLGFLKMVLIAVHAPAAVWRVLAAMTIVSLARMVTFYMGMPATGVVLLDFTGRIGCVTRPQRSPRLVQASSQHRLLPS